MNHIVTDSEWKSRLHPAFGLVIDLDGVGGPYTIDRPFVVGGRVYATDRRICVRAPLPDGIVECMVMPCRCDSRGSRHELIRQ